jgi:hypothetical protein
MEVPLCQSTRRTSKWATHTHGGIGTDVVNPVPPDASIARIVRVKDFTATKTGIAAICTRARKRISGGVRIESGTLRNCTLSGRDHDPLK